MKSLPSADILFGWSDHFSALRWLGLLYRRPQQFEAVLSTFSIMRQLTTALLLLIHSIPYLLAISASGRFLAVTLIGAEFRLASMVLGIALGIALGITLGMILGIPGGLASTLALGVALGIVEGLASEIALGIALGIAFGITLEVSFGTFGHTLGIALGFASGFAFGTVFGAAFGILFGLFSTRMYYLLAHPLFVWPHVQGRWYPHHPVAWDDCCNVPFPSLDQLLVAYAEKEPESGGAEIERLRTNYPNQRNMALRAQIRMLARKAGATTNLAILDEIVAALPEGKTGFLVQTERVRSAVHDIARAQRRLDTNDRPVAREPFAQVVCKEIETFLHEIGDYYEPLATEFRKAAKHWQEIAARQLQEAQAVVAKRPLLQVFRAGDPVDREREAFVPRDAVTGNLERQVLLSTGCPGVVLYGRRRVGKSTVLRNLSGFLPSTVRTVNVSMQRPAASTSLGLLVQHLIGEISEVISGEQATHRAAKDLNDLFTFLSETNKILETADRRLVISLDEYENIDEKIGQGVFPEDLLAAFRESIQTHRRITWIFAGGHEITELAHAPWTSYLVSAQTVEVPLFSMEESRLLLTEPLRYSSLWRNDGPGPRPRFESGFWGEGGIERIHTEAGGWPHLVQLIAQTIVDLLNTDGGRHVTLPLMDRAFDQAVFSGQNVLYELIRRESTLPREWEYLYKFRGCESQPPPDDQAIVQSLRRRLLVTEEAEGWRLRAPLMSRWLRMRG
jgi:hypothetical protein